jgi:hypothetical protein
VSYVDATLSDTATFPVLGQYAQTDHTKDILGNFGFGIAYSFYDGDRARLAAQLEGEGFFGHRDQKTSENLPFTQGGIVGPTVSINNELYGAIGRLTFRYQYAFGAARAIKAFVDVGMETKYSYINYSASGLFSGGTFNELLWGPYARVGLRYSF